MAYMLQGSDCAWRLWVTLGFLASWQSLRHSPCWKPIVSSISSALLLVRFATKRSVDVDSLPFAEWNVLRKDIPYSTKVGKGAVTAFSGFLVLSVALALLILVLGNSPAKSRNEPAQVIQNPVSAPPPPMTSTAV